MQMFLRTYLAPLALASIVAAPAYLVAQQPSASGQDHTHQTPATPAPPAQGRGSMMQGQGPMMQGPMMQMMHDMEAQDAKLQALVDKMNTSTGAEKTEAMAALLTALVAERPAMHQHMMQMMQMMGQMAPAGAPPAGRGAAKKN